MAKQTKYIFITGGVVSSLGKGLTCASIGMILENLGLKIAMMKLDPYLNVDPGTMNPFQHGEVYVTDDGAETDLDLGHYFRFTQTPLSKRSNTTSGQIFDTVLKNERRGEYLGKTVQVIPHITDEIKRRIHLCAEQKSDTDIVIIEVGGTIGDIESLPFLEAIRQFNYEYPDQSLNIHMTYIPYLKAAEETKTKPTQHSTQTLRSLGINPDIIICRCEKDLSMEVKKKISAFCNVPVSAVITAFDVQYTIYELPLILCKQNLDQIIANHFQLPYKKPSFVEWKELIEVIKKPKEEIKIGLVGKYAQFKDADMSVREALEHAGFQLGYSIQLIALPADEILENGELKPEAKNLDGYLVPGGFGKRGFEGKIKTAQYCRENNIPYFGICLGLQVMLIEFAQNVLKLDKAMSTEVDPQTPHPVISLLKDQKIHMNLGGTMRLGSYPCSLVPQTKALQAYKTPLVHERHRHRYEFNNNYKELFEANKMLFSGIWEELMICEIAELQTHLWMLGVQFHPEFQSKPLVPHPLFVAFVQSAIQYKKHAHE